jgi:DNA repair protein RadC
MTAAMADLPAHERPRERLLRVGPESLSERELLALVLRDGRRGQSALALAASLLVEYQGLAGLAAARPEELASHPGVGAAKAAALVAAFRLGRLARGTVETPTLRGAGDVAAVAGAELAGLRRERVLVLVCGARNRLRHTVTLTEGSAERSLLPIRDILNAVLRHDGCAFAIAHNHPSGDPAPSEEDRLATAKLMAASRTVGLRFLGHVIVAGEDWRSVPIPGSQTPR